MPPNKPTTNATDAHRKPTDAQPERVKGPASHFPSIEQKYGRPIPEWLALIEASPLRRHMELVAWLKSEHGLGHGHANALVAYALAPTADAG
jgi:hypothetical protein